MKDPKFYTKNGRLTSYALACGYIENVGGYLELSSEHNIYHVKAFIGSSRYWFSYNSLTKARKAYDFLKKPFELGIITTEQLNNPILKEGE